VIKKPCTFKASWVVVKISNKMCVLDEEKERKNKANFTFKFVGVIHDRYFANLKSDYHTLCPYNLRE